MAAIVLPRLGALLWSGIARYVLWAVFAFVVDLKMYRKTYYIAILPLLCATLALVVYYAGPPVLWGDSAVCVIQKYGVLVTADFPIDRSVVAIPAVGGLRSDSLRLSVGYANYTPLPAILDDYQFAIEPMRHAYKMTRFAGFDAAIGTDNGRITRGDWTTHILVPAKSVTVSISFQSSNEEISPELQKVLDSIVISPIDSVSTDAHCYQPLLPIKP